MSFNLQFVLGNLTSDAIVKSTNGKFVINLSLAQTKKWMANNELKERVEYFDVEFWTNSADQKDFLNVNLKKGHSAIVVGERRTEQYVDKDGVTRKSYKIIADRLDPLGKLQLAKANSTDSAPAPAPTPAPAAASVPAAAATPVPQAPVASSTTLSVDMSIPPGQFMAKVFTNGFEGMLTGTYELLRKYEQAGQGKIIAMGPPLLLPAAPLPEASNNPPVSEHHIPPLPLDDEIERSPGLNSAQHETAGVAATSTDRPF